MGTGFSPPQPGIPHAGGDKKHTVAFRRGQSHSSIIFLQSHLSPLPHKVAGVQGSLGTCIPLFFLKSVTLYAERFVAE